MEFHLALLISMVVLDMADIHSRSRMNARACNRDGYPASIVFMEFHVGLLQVVSMAILYGYGILIRSRMRALSIEMGTRLLIVFMEYDLALLVSIAVLDGYGIHIRSKNARAFNRDRYPASDCVYGISSGPTGQYGSAG